MDAEGIWRPDIRIGQEKTKFCMRYSPNSGEGVTGMSIPEPGAPATEGAGDEPCEEGAGDEPCEEGAGEESGAAEVSGDTEPTTDASGEGVVGTFAGVGALLLLLLLLLVAAPVGAGVGAPVMPLLLPAL